MCSFFTDWPHTILVDRNLVNSIDNHELLYFGNVKEADVPTYLLRPSVRPYAW